MKTIVALLVLAALVGVVVWQYHTQYLVLADHKRQVHDASVSPSVAAQQQCSEQARARFRQPDPGDAKQTVYKSRYNATLSRCFMQIDTTNASLGTVWKYVTLSDAVEGEVVGSYSWHSLPGKKDSEVTPFTCEVVMPTGEKQLCKSDEEFRNLIKFYLK